MYFTVLAIVLHCIVELVEQQFAYLVPWYDPLLFILFKSQQHVLMSAQTGSRIYIIVYIGI